MTEIARDDGLKRVIGFWGGLSLIVGITIGSGIFRKPVTLARDVGDPTAILALWVGFGLVSLCGALAVAELSTMLPQTGGVYVFLCAAYGDAAAFVFGWLYLLVTTPATIGALSTFFAELCWAWPASTRVGRRPGPSRPSPASRCSPSPA
jgi:basic amino acid/polyamine antiporter, APA family